MGLSQDNNPELCQVLLGKMNKKWGFFPNSHPKNLQESEGGAPFCPCPELWGVLGLLKPEGARQGQVPGWGSGGWMDPELTLGSVGVTPWAPGHPSMAWARWTRSHDPDRGNDPD